MATDTLTSVSDAPTSRAGREAWALAVALDCEQLLAPPLRIGLGAATEVEIGRGEQRAFRRDGLRLRLDLADARASQLHLRLLRDRDGWRVEDAGSKNGTRVNGVRVQARELDDGDVIECGGTFLVLRQGAPPIGDLETNRRGPAALETLSPDLERELAVLPRIARSRVTVLVRGDSGTGKELVAAAVHELSGRRGPLVPLNCAALPETLVESELFGTRKGAFSGAADRPGLARSAEGGTLFLDEIAEMSMPAQAALLRLLQEGEILPLGSARSQNVDVRVVAATNQPIEQLIAAGRFRRDLHARLRGHEVHLLPLRRRIEDLGVLIAALLRRLEPDGPPRRLAREAARALFLHTWPNHIRELEQALRRALTVADGPEIRASDLMLMTEPGVEPVAVDLGRDRLAGLLRTHLGNLSAVARHLGTSRSQVRRLLDRHGLPVEDFRRR